MSSFLIGPAFVSVYTDPTSEADHTVLNEVEEVNFGIGVRTAFVATAQSAGTPIADGVYSMPPEPEAQVSLNDAALDMMITIMLGGELFTGAGAEEALGFGGDIEQLVLPGIAIIPSFESDQGVAAPNAIWLPRVLVNDFSNLVYNRMQAGETNNQYNVTFQGTRAHTDGADQELPLNAQYGWKGDPTALGLTTPYVLPTLEAGIGG